ncbi:unnamed protein product [Echinostoma caproni]|uniref:Methionine--tRNA ligase, mitochondrial n=1 Tax=Echinostoma caproni TaxID=27848 RepID=A0A183ABP4_9TREM|nr:unnamed protein product [Echinostoma caproni]
MLCQRNSVGLSDFIRTTEERHKQAVEAFWTRLTESGSVYESSYSGWYSVSDEAFYTDWEIVTETQQNSGQGRSAPDQQVTHVAKETGHTVEWMEERTHMFRLSAFKPQLHEWLDSGAFLEQAEAQHQWKIKAHEMVDTARDISLSRPRSRLEWGISVPNDPDHVIYVWLDALINYLTVTGFPWSKAKSFHAVLWPALLLAVGLDLPKHLICHNHLLVDGIKMSKSRRNVADPFDEQLALSPVPPEQLAVPSSDSEGLRYILIRVTSTRLNPSQSVVRINRTEAGALFEQFKEDAELLNQLDTLAEKFDNSWWVQAQPHLAIEHVLQVIRLTNAMIDRHKPWEKNPAVESEHVIALAAESLRLAGLLLSPVIPNLASRLLKRLGLGQALEDPSDEQLPHEKLFWSLGPDQGPLVLRLP